MLSLDMHPFIKRNVFSGKLIHCLGCKHIRNRNLSSCDLSGIDLAGVDLSEAVLRGANLSNTNIHKANTEDTDLFFAIMSDVGLRSLKCKK